MHTWRKCGLRVPPLTNRLKAHSMRVCQNLCMVRNQKEAKKDMKNRAVTLTLVCLSLIGLILTGQSHAALTPQDSVAVWILDEGAGNAAKDLSGNGNDAQLNGSTWVDGKFGKGLELGQDTSIMSSSAKGVSPTFLSECLWVNFSDFSTENQFGYINGSGTASARYFYFSTWCAAGPPHDCIHLGTTDPAGAWGRGIATAKMFDPGKWYFVCGVINNQDGVTRAYVDGELKHEQNFPTGDTPGTPTQIWIGGTPENYQWINGSVDEIGFFNVALTPDDIKMVMEQGLGKVFGSATAVEPSGKLATTWGSIKGQ